MYQRLHRLYYGIGIVLFCLVMHGQAQAREPKASLSVAFCSRKTPTPPVPRSDRGLFRAPVYAGVLKENPELKEIIDSGLGAMPLEALVVLEQRWFPDPADHYYNKAEHALALTGREKAWLAAREGPVVVGAETDWPPYDFTEDGEVKGYSNDLLCLAAQKTGLSLEFISGFTWAQLIDKFGKGQVEIMPAIYVTPEKEKSMAFTQSYAVNPSVLVSHEASADIRGLEDLSGKKLAVPKGFSLSKHLAETHPNIRQVGVPNVLASIRYASRIQRSVLPPDEFMAALLPDHFVLWKPRDTAWSNHLLPVTEGQAFHMSSDGIFDQVGGPKRMGFGKKRLRMTPSG